LQERDPDENDAKLIRKTLNHAVLILQTTRATYEVIRCLNKRSARAGHHVTLEETADEVVEALEELPKLVYDNRISQWGEVPVSPNPSKIKQKYDVIIQRHHFSIFSDLFLKNIL
jgi:hypothetical protein